MANVEAFKDKARKLELKEQWAKAIQEYSRAIEAMEKAPDGAHDLSLYNRVGDLYQRVGDVQSAIREYERAMDRYAEGGFHNNAIALCNKILRLAPGRTEVYLRLGSLYAAKGFGAEAKQHLLEYASRMQKAGKLEAAFAALKQFAELSPGQEDIWGLLAEQARAEAKTPQAQEAVEKLLGEFVAQDTAVKRRRTQQDLVFLDIGEAPAPVAGPAAEATEREPTEAPATAEAEPEPEAGLAVEPLVLESTSLADEPGSLAVGGAIEIEPTSAELGLEALVPMAEPPAVSGDLTFLDLGAVPEQAAEPFSLSELESRVARHPEDWNARRELGEALIESGQRERGIEQLDSALRGLENFGDLSGADAIAEGLLRLDPNSIRHHQKRVELAYREGDVQRLVAAYVALGDALLRVDAVDKAVAVYRRILEHDSENAHAQAALATLAPLEPSPPPPPPAATAARPAAGVPAVPAAPPADARKTVEVSPHPVVPAGVGTEFVDLAALVLEDEVPRDTRLKVGREEPTGDERRDFDEMLATFKKGIAASVSEEDFQSHYDLGIAFKEMGLLDEAIAEFQKALRAPAGRLKASEALGLCFIEKGQFAVAETILRRAVELPGADDSQRIGLLYWLARALEEQGRGAEALRLYHRVVAVDINFQDAARRLSALAGAAG